VGAPAAVSNGPSTRFIAGTHNMAAKLAQAVAPHGLKPRAGDPVAVRAEDGVPRTSDDVALEETV
jgi:hypothetical protein